MESVYNWFVLCWEICPLPECPLSEVSLCIHTITDPFGKATLMDVAESIGEAGPAGIKEVEQDRELV